MQPIPKPQPPADVDRQNSNTPASIPLLVPSLTDLIFIILLLAFSFGALAPRLLWDGDIGWHIRDGQNILASHSIPRVDSFSATMTGRPWYAWEWLYDAAIGWTHNVSGLNGVVFISALMIAATLALVFRFSLRRGGSLPVTIVLFAFCAMASSIHFLARPHIMGWLLALIWFWVLDRNHRNETRLGSLLWLPPLMLLWANLHGGFAMGFVLLGIYMLADVLTFFRCADLEQRLRSRRRAAILIVIGFASFVASLANPYGFRLHIHIYQYLADRFLMQHINEFQRPDIHGAPAQAFFVIIALTLLGIIVVRGRMRWANWLLIVFSIVSGLYAARNLPFSSMLLMIVAAPLLSQKLDQNALSVRLKRWGEFELTRRLPIWPTVAVLIGLVVCLHQGRVFGRQLMNADFDPSRFPVQAVNMLQQQGIRDPIFSLDSWGGYFIYRLYPENKVFVDDRHDFYGDAYIREYLKLIHLEPGWQQVLDGWGVNVIVLPSKNELSRTLRSSRDWKIMAQDPTAIIFRRAAS